MRRSGKLPRQPGRVTGRHFIPQNFTLGPTPISMQTVPWNSLDTWTALTAAAAAIACALPGVFLVLRRQSLLGDALSHTALPGVVVGYLATHALESRGLLPTAFVETGQRLFLFAGATIAGLLTAWLAEALGQIGRIDRTASLAVIFSAAFAFGLLLLRLEADTAHLDPDHVLFGVVELSVLDTVKNTPIPRSLVTAVIAIGLNGLFIVCFFKELRTAAFDPAYAVTTGIPVRRLNFAQIALTAITLVAAFESVGSILAIAMLVLPAAAARFLTTTLGGTLAWACALAAVSGIAGHAASFLLPPLLFPHIGLENVHDAGTAGAMAAIAGILFLAAVFVGPCGGLLIHRRAASAYGNAGIPK